MKSTMETITRVSPIETMHEQSDRRPHLTQRCSLDFTMESSKPIPNSLISSFSSYGILPRKMQRSCQRLATNSNTSCPLLDTLPNEVLSRDILGFLTDKGTKNFFQALGKTRLQSHSFSEIRNQFCVKHGSKFEMTESFVTSHKNNNETQQQQQQQQQNSIVHKRKRSCPECFAEQHETKRCHGCKIFYPNSHNSENNEAFPGLKCQKCDYMAFCRACLSNEQPRTCGQSTRHHHLSSSFGRKHSGSDPNRKTSSCHNYCCSSFFTNTMCGEYVCSDCCDDHQKALRHSFDDHSGSSSMEICNDCGKSTCLDPHCLVCADFKLIHLVCEFSPEDAYRVDLGGLLFGSKRNGSNLNNKLRRTISDCMVWIVVGLMLSKMWLKLS